MPKKRQRDGDTWGINFTPFNPFKWSCGSLLLMTLGPTLQVFVLVSWIFCDLARGAKCWQRAAWKKKHECVNPPPTHGIFRGICLGKHCISIYTLEDSTTNPGFSGGDLLFVGKSCILYLYPKKDSWYSWNFVGWNCQKNCLFDYHSGWFFFVVVICW